MENKLKIFIVYSALFIAIMGFGIGFIMTWRSLFNNLVRDEDKPPILPKYGVDIDYPKSWSSRPYYALSFTEEGKPTKELQAKENPALLNTIEIVDLFPNEVQDNVSIQIDLEELPRKMSLEQAYEEVVRVKLENYSHTSNSEIYNNNSLQHSTYTLASRKPAYKVEYSRFDGETTSKGMIVFTGVHQIKDKYYIVIVHYQARDQNLYQSYLKDAESIARSLQLSSPQDISIPRGEKEESLPISRSNVFFCGEIDETPTIVARHHWGNVPIIKFKLTDFEKEDWTPQKRCEVIAGRLADFHKRGILVHLEVAYPPGDLLKLASDLIKNKSGKFSDLNMLEAAEIFLNEIELSKLKRPGTPVICISAIKGKHQDIPVKYVGLLMTLRYQDNPKKVLARLQKIGSDPGEIVLH